MSEFLFTTKVEIKDTPSNRQLQEMLMSPNLIKSRAAQEAAIEVLGGGIVKTWKENIAQKMMEELFGDKKI